MNTIGRLVILVREYEEAIAFYRDKLGFEVFVDIESGDLRFVHVRLPGQSDMGVWLLKATSDEQRACVGKQTAGQPCAVFYTDNLDSDYEKLCARGVKFIGPPESDGNSKYAHFEDLYGNVFVLVELTV